MGKENRVLIRNDLLDQDVLPYMCFSGLTAWTISAHTEISDLAHELNLLNSNLAIGVHDENFRLGRAFVFSAWLTWQ